MGQLTYSSQCDREEGSAGEISEVGGRLAFLSMWAQESMHLEPPSDHPDTWVPLALHDQSQQDSDHPSTGLWGNQAGPLMS